MGLETPAGLVLDSCVDVLHLLQHAPTNKLLYAKDVPGFKQEVKSYYKQIRDQPTITDSEFQDFLREESKVAHTSPRNT